jgi:plasmid maintenance system antidote protein VapI
MGNTMNLKEYLFFKRMTVKEFSQIMDYSRTHMSSIVNGTATAGIKLAKRIEKFTDGELKAIDLMKENDKRYKTRKLDSDQEIIEEVK